MACWKSFGKVQREKLKNKIKFWEIKNRCVIIWVWIKIEWLLLACWKHLGATGEIWKKVKFCTIWEVWGGFCMSFILVQHINGKNLPDSTNFYFFIFIYISHAVPWFNCFNFPCCIFPKRFQRALNGHSKLIQTHMITYLLFWTKINDIQNSPQTSQILKKYIFFKFRLLHLSKTLPTSP